MAQTAFIIITIIILIVNSSSLRSRKRWRMVKALRYKPEGRGFDSQWFHSGIFHCHNPMALGLTQPLTEMSTKNSSWR